MFGLREAIAVFSAICALMLLALTVRGVLRNRTVKRLRFFTLSVYGALFAVTAIILWIREPVRTPPVVTPNIEISRSKSAIPPDCSEVADQPVRKESVQIKDNSSASDIAVFNPLDARSATRRAEQQGRSEAAVNELRTAASDEAANKADKRNHREVWDEQVAGAVTHAFDAIELWFWRYGSPSPERMRNRSTRSADVHRVVLPDIYFIKNTAEMTFESTRRLRRFAADLISRPQTGEIEIQAQTDGDGPAPFQFILTQARAEVVRDFLSKEGVLNYRLIATAMNQESEDSTTAKSQIRFVFRP